jgi:hypothetical protein
VRSRVRRAALGTGFAVAFAVAGLGESALLWTVDRSYFASVAAEERLGQRPFHSPSGDAVLGADRVLTADGGIRRYVLCGCGDVRESPVYLSEGEAGHLRDVAGVYSWIQPLAHVAALLSLLIGALAWRTDPAALRLAALAGAGATALIGALAAVAFEALFLAFHAVFFPQGNYLFDPRTENLTLLYPPAYWFGVTLRVGATFVFMALTVAALASVRLAAMRRQLAR